MANGIVAVGQVAVADSLLHENVAMMIDSNNGRVHVQFIYAIVGQGASLVPRNVASHICSR
jgi:hypothetical protein